jgi:hypothetical protein
VAQMLHELGRAETGVQFTVGAGSRSVRSLGPCARVCRSDHHAHKGLGYRFAPNVNYTPGTVVY